MANELAATARCLHCGKLFAGPSALAIGGGLSVVDNRRVQFLETLTRHVLESHKPEAADVLNSGAEYQTFLMLSNYKTEDKNMLAQLDLVRWKTHQRSLAKRFTDKMIGDWVEKIVPDLVTLANQGNTLAITSHLTGMLQSMRDILEEPGKYVPEGSKVS